MKTIVCIKQVPATNDAQIDPETKRIVREGLKAVLNPYDLYAVEEAIRLRERYGGEVVVVTMGPEKALAALRETLAIGADRAVLLSDRAFGGSDTYATSYALFKAIEKIAAEGTGGGGSSGGAIGLILSGKQAVDGDTAQVGPGIAAHGGWQQATYVTAIDDIDLGGDNGGNGGSAIVKRMNEIGYDVCKVGFPAVCTVVKGINEPRVPSLKDALRALDAEIPVWRPEDIGADTAKIGLEASPTRVVKTEPPPARSKETRKVAGTPQECAAGLLEALGALGVAFGTGGNESSSNNNTANNGGRAL